jgi:hypothetical protein
MLWTITINYDEGPWSLNIVTLVTNIMKEISLDPAAPTGREMISLVMLYLP